ncbi:MAG TPA: aminotransferase [Rhizomicrobium sp.]|nr:aminotransferase [Rhizomicrobium sp.]
MSPIPRPPLTNAQTRDVNSILHPYTNLVKLRQTGALVVERGQGVRVYDDHGKDYIEAMAGLWSTALGWGENVLADVAAEQMRKLAFGHLFSGRSHEPAIALAEKLKEVMPFAVGKVFFASSGSEANDTQIKLHWYAANARGKTQKKKIISRNRAYHGVTLASASLTGLPANHTSFDLPFSFAVFTDCPHYYRGAEAGESEEAYSARLAQNLEALIGREGPDTIAAMIAEPVMGAGGAIIPPKGYFDAITKVLAAHDIPLIADEVITGFGRTGEWFGCSTYGFEPDSMSIAKALSSSYLPISAVALSPELSEIIEEESGRIGTFGHGFTYGGHPVACAVALKTIEIYQERDIVGHVRHVSPAFLKRLTRLADHPLVGEARGVGLIGAVELIADKQTRRAFDPAKAVAATIVRFCEEEGLIVRSLMGDRIAFCPPLIITEAEIDELFDRFERGLAKGLAWVKENGLLG